VLLEYYYYGAAGAGDRCLHQQLLLLLLLSEKGLNSMLDEFLSFFSPPEGVCEAVACSPIPLATQFETAARHLSIRHKRAVPWRRGRRPGTTEIYHV